MNAPDPGYVRTYENERRRHRTAVVDLLAGIATEAARLHDRAERGVVVFPGDATSLATDAMRLVERLAALDALNEVAYLVETPPDPGDPQ